MTKPENPSLLDWEPTESLSAAPFSQVTLRDIFAAFAAAGFLAQPEHYRPQDVPEMAYEAADGLLAERERDDEPPTP